MTTSHLSFLAAAGLAVLSLDNTVAAPSGGTVRSGSATFGRGEQTLTILQSTPRLSLDWKDFSIGAGETVRFVQPNARSIALNRVTSGNPSLIYGTLQANGRVFLLNPNGILVGPNGVINTRSFMGSTLDGPDDQFFKGGRLTLSGDSLASIKNEGSISALGGSVYLVARTVENSGSIHAPQGHVGLAAGSEVIVHDTKGVVGVVAGKTSDSQAETGVNNTGLIEAASAQLQAAGGNVYALAINNGGVIRANSLVRENGRILLKASGGDIRNSGTLSAHTADGKGGSVILDAGHQAAVPTTAVNSGTIEARGDDNSGQGGRAQITGDNVQLATGSSIDVSGGSGGGTVLVGGDARGGNPAVQNAHTTSMAAGAAIRADALQHGNGGKVVLWADETTAAHGSISARGGLLGGNGGFVETSGKLNLDISGASVTAGAPHGRAGNWLLDPTDYVIHAGQAASLQAALESGTSVEVATASVGPDSGDLTVAAPINKFTGPLATLTLRAHRDISVNDSITLVNGELTLNAGRDINGTSWLNVDGRTELNAGQDITARLENGSFYGPLFLSGRDVDVTSDRATTLGRSTITGDFSLHSAGDISQSGPLSVVENTTLEITDNVERRSIILSEANNLQGRVILAGTRVLDFALNNLVAPVLNLGLSQFRDLSLAFASGDASLAGVTADVLALDMAGDFTLRGINSIARLGDIRGNKVSLTVGGDIEQVSETSLNVASDFTLAAGGRIKLDQDNHLNGSVGLSTESADVAGGPVAAVIRNAEDLQLGDVSVANGTLDIQTKASGGGELSRNVSQSADTAVKAKNLTATVSGDLLLESKQNEFETLGRITVDKKFSLFDSSFIAGSYSDPAIGPVVFTPGEGGSKTLGLEIAGAIVGRDGITIRTRGDLNVGTAATLDARGGASDSDVILSAEKHSGGSADFHYFPASPVLNTDGRYIIYSTTAVNNTPVTDPELTTMEFGLPTQGITADQTFESLTFDDPLPVGYEGDNLFVFADPQNLRPPDESSKFVVDVLRIKPITAVTFDLDRSKLPVPESEDSIYTSSYHVYAEEAEGKKKKKATQKRMARRELKPSPLALNWEPLR